LPDTIEELETFHKYDNELIDLPKNLKKLHINGLFNKNVDNLPESLEELDLVGTNFDKPIVYLPKSLKKLSIGYNFNHELNTKNLPENLEYLKIYGSFDMDLSDLPKSTNTLCIHSKMKVNLSNISPYVETLIIDDSTISESLVVCDLPETIKQLILNSHYIEIINLPNKLEYLEVSYLSIIKSMDLLNMMNNKIQMYVRDIPQKDYDKFVSKISDNIVLLSNRIRKY
jgi:hypothetical protein